MIFGCWNVQGIMNKINFLPVELKTANIDIAVITETKRKGRGEELTGNYVHLWSGVDKNKHAKAGIAIMIRKQLRNKITNWIFHNERTLSLYMTLFGREVCIIGTYAPTNDANEEIKNKYWDEIRDIIENIPKRKELFLLGDLNARVGNKQGDNVVGRFGEKSSNDNGKRLIEICEQADLRIQNTFFQHKDIHRYTWHQDGKNLRSVIDLFISRQNTSATIRDVRVYRGSDCGSDHYLVKAHTVWNWSKSYTKTSSMRKEVKECYPFYKVDLLQDESIKGIYKKRLEARLSINLEGTSEDIYNHLKRNVSEVAAEILGSRSKLEEKGKKWINEEILKGIQVKKKAFQNWLNKKDTISLETYKSKKKELFKTIRRCKNEEWDRTCANINSQLGFKKASAAWQILKGLRTNSQHKTKIEMMDINTWKKYFEELLGENRNEFKDPNEFVHQKLDIEIKTYEVEKALSEGKNGRSPGPGGLNLELLKYGGNCVVRVLTLLYNKILEGDPVPVELKEGYIIPIYKKGNKKLCSNYRGICVTSPVMKIFGRILRNKIEEEYKGIEEQCGFSAGKSCIDHIFVLRQILEKQRDKGRITELIFVDLEKAYDSVPRILLWKALEMAGISANLINIIKALYFGNSCRVKIGNSFSDPFFTSKGLLQGCCLSPTLFKIYIDVCLREWTRKCSAMGLKINNRKFIHHLLFADDQVIIAEDAEDADYMFRKLKSTYIEWGLNINTCKTEHLTTSLNCEDISEIINLNSVEEFKYLGSIIHQDGSCNREIEKRIGEGRKVIAMLNPVLWNSNILPKTKRQIFTSIVQSIMLYGSETWTIDLAHKKKLLSTEMDFWRRSARKSRIEKVRNSTIRELMNVKHDILQTIEMNRMKWYGHVHRMDTERLPKVICEWQPKGRRRRGRPRLNWMDAINTFFKTHKLNKNIPSNRKLWKKTISNILLG